MPSSAAELDLTRVPFGRAGSPVMVFRENNCDGEKIQCGLYFTMLVQGGSARRKGLVDIVPWLDGAPIDFSYTAVPGKLQIITLKGKIDVVIDTPKTVRIRGNGVGARLYTKIPFMTMENATMLPGELADLNLMSINNDGGRFFFKAIRGKIVLNSYFNVRNNGPEDAEIQFIPDETGSFEVAGYTMNPDEWGYIEYRTIEEASEDTLKEFAEFSRYYPEVQNTWEELRQKAVYGIWLNKKSPNDCEVIPTMRGELIYSDSISHGWAYTYEQPLHALAMQNTDRAAKLISDMLLHMKNGMLPVKISTFKTHYQACPPTVGVAMVKILKRSGGAIPKENLEDIYTAMQENFKWWKTSHCYGTYRFAYNHRDELELEDTSYNALEFPLETPDLYTLMILYIEALAKLSNICGDGQVETWRQEQKAVTDELLKLWNGEEFECRAAISGKIFKTKSLLACMPVVLGDRIPPEIVKKLSDRLGNENEFLSERGLRSESKKSEYYESGVTGRGAVVAWLQQLIITGLFDCGETETAKKAAEKYLTYAGENDPRDVFSAEGLQPVRRPGAFVNAVAGAAVIEIAAYLNRRG